MPHHGHDVDHFPTPWTAGEVSTPEPAGSEESAAERCRDADFIRPPPRLRPICYRDHSQLPPSGVMQATRATAPRPTTRSSDNGQSTLDPTHRHPGPERATALASKQRPKTGPTLKSDRPKKTTHRSPNNTKQAKAQRDPEQNKPTPTESQARSRSDKAPPTAQNPKRSGTTRTKAPESQARS